MGKRVYLHVGWEKTGSSAIQVFCARNQGWLNDRGLCYPLMGTLPQHARLYLDLSAGYASRVQRSLDAIRDEIARCEQDAIIFSHESLHCCSPAIFAEMFEGHDVQVIAYLRRPDSAMISFFVTMARYGEFPIGDLFGAMRRFVRLNLGRFEYAWTLQGFTRVFGRDALRVRHYHPDALTGGQTLSDFMHVLGIEDLSGAKWADDQVNLSLDADQLAIVLHFARTLRELAPSVLCSHTRTLCDALVKHGAPDRTRDIQRFVPPRLRDRLMSCWQDSFPMLYENFFDGRAIFDEALGVETQEYEGIETERAEALAGAMRTIEWADDRVRETLALETWSGLCRESYLMTRRRAPRTRGSTIA